MIELKGDYLEGGGSLVRVTSYLPLTDSVLTLDNFVKVFGS